MKMRNQCFDKNTALKWIKAAVLPVAAHRQWHRRPHNLNKQYKRGKNRNLLRQTSTVSNLKNSIRTAQNIFKYRNTNTRKYQMQGNKQRCDQEFSCVVRTESNVPKPREDCAINRSTGYLLISQPLLRKNAPSLPKRHFDCINLNTGIRWTAC